MTNTNSLFDLIMLAMGVYVLYSAVTGKGRLYAAENIRKEKKDDFLKTMRKLYAVLGVMMVLNAACSMVKNRLYELKEVVAATETAAAQYEWTLIDGVNLGQFAFVTPTLLDVLTYVFLGLSLAVIIVMIVYLRKVSYKRGEAPQDEQNGEGGQQQQQRGSFFGGQQPRPAMPSSAFHYTPPEAPAADGETAAAPLDGEAIATAAAPDEPEA